MAGQVVNITINVSDGNASEIVEQVVGQLHALGPAGEAGGNQAAAGLDKVSEHALTSLDSVRLLRDDLGVHIPRAMEKVISQSAMMSGAIGMIGPGMIAVGAADILINMGDKLVAAYNKWVLMKDEISSVSEAVKLFGDMSSHALEQQRAAQEHYIEVTQGSKAAGQFKLSNVMSDSVDMSQYFNDDRWKKAPEDIKDGFQRIAGTSIAPMDLDTVISRLQKYEDKQKEILSTAQQLPHNTGGLLQVSSGDLLKDQQRVDLGSAILKGLTDKRDAIVAEINSVYADVDKAKPGTDDQQEAARKEKEKLATIGRLQEEAHESELKGDALVDAQRQKAINDFVAQYGQSRAAMAAIDEIYDAKLLDLWDKEAAEKKRKDDAALKVTEDAVMAEWKMQDEAAEALLRKQKESARIDEALSKEELQAGRAGLAGWEQSILAVEDAYVERLQKIKEDVELHVMNETQGARAVTAAWQSAQVEIQKSQEETRDKIASGLQSLFSNPAQFFEKRAMDTAFQMMANQMLSAFQSASPTGGMLQYLFGMGPQMSTSTNLGTDVQSVLGIGGHNSGAHGLSSLTSASTSTAALSTFQSGSATLLSGSQVLLNAASVLQSSGSMGMGSGTAGSMSNGGFGMLGSTGSALGGTSQGTAGMGSPLSLAGGLGSYTTAAGNGVVDASSLSGSAFSSSSSSLSLAGGGGSYTTAAGNDVVDASSLGPAGSGWSSSQAGSGLTGAQMTTMAGGAFTAGAGILSAFENSNPTAGLMSGAMGGASIGSVFGPVGSVVGAVAGGVAGLLAGIFGDQGRSAAESLDVNTVQPTLLKDMQDYEAGRSGYSTLSNDLSSLLISSQNSTNQMGSGARSYFSSNIAPEINSAILSLQKQEIGGRSQVTMSAAQYHSGGWVNDFGDLGTSENEGYIHAMQNEFMVTPTAAAAHAPILQAMNSGTNFGYSNTVQPRMPVSSSGGGGGNITIQAIDSKSVATWAKAGGGRALVAAMNQANRQYSGVGRG